MPTVPNWIAKGYVYTPSYGTREASCLPVEDWRATTTQVVVTVKTQSLGSVEHRFTLDGLRQIGRPDRASLLLAPDDQRVTKALARTRLLAVLATLDMAIEPADLRPSRIEDAEQAAVVVGRIQRAATKALADLADLL
jgi:hypothetical protein